jgi:hypothetical protein
MISAPPGETGERAALDLEVMANRLHSKAITNLVGVEGADKLLENGKGRLPLKKLAQNIAFNAYISSTRQLHMTKRTDTGFNEHRPGNGAAVDDPGEVRPNESIERRRVCEVGQIELDRRVYGSYAIRRERRSSVDCQHFDDPPANEAGRPGHENGPFIAHVAPPCRVELKVCLPSPPAGM